MVKFCPNCGNLVDENTTFCPKCGHKITLNHSKNISQSLEEQPSNFSNKNNNLNRNNKPYDNRTPDDSSQYGMLPQPRQSFSKVEYPSGKPLGKIIAVLLAVAIVVIVILALYFFVFSEEELSGEDKAKEVVREFINGLDDENWDKIFSMQMKSDGSFYNGSEINKMVEQFESSNISYQLKNFKILNVTKLDYNIENTDEIYKVRCKFNLIYGNGFFDNTRSENFDDYLYVAKNKNNGKWGVSFSKFYSEDDWDDDYSSTPTLTLSQDDTLAETGGQWVNFTVNSVSASAKWSDLKIIVNGTNLGYPSYTDYPASDQCGHNSGGDSIYAGDNLYCQLSTDLESGDAKIQVVHTPSNSIIMQKTIM